MRISLLAFLLSFISFSLAAQKKNQAYVLNLRHASSAIVIDGIMDESGWKDTDVARDFNMVLPMDTTLANVLTEVRMTHDEENLYLIAICYNGKPGPYMVESLRRDFNFGKNDNFLLFMDTFDDQTNGFSFGANAAGAQWDGIMYDGGKVDLSWDNKWTSEVKNYDDRWVFEMAIPFKSIRYKKGITEWGINFSRNDLKAPEKSSWAPVPRQFPTASLAYSGTLMWDEPPPQAGPNISLIPFVLGGGSRDYENKKPTEYRLEIGGDAKIAITSSLNLDVTINPDFSQVDVDRQVTNLDRYELFFPEKRQFFLENGDLFANFGYATIRPFFSRRIGLDVPINFGARFSGKINKNWRIGAMDMQTDDVASKSLPKQNFAVFSLQRRVFARSTVGLMYINKQSLNYTVPSSDTIPTYSLYNRNLGVEYNLASSNNKWTGKATFLKSFSPNTKGNDLTQATNLTYTTRKWIISWQHELVGKNYNAEVGYVPRKGYFRIYPSIARLFFPKASIVLSHGPTLSSSYFFNDAFKRTDNESTFNYGFTFRDFSTLSGFASNTYVQILQPFDPTRSGKDSLEVGSIHKWNSVGGTFISKPQKLFTFGFTALYGGYYADGTRLTLTNDIGYRIQPYVSLTVSTSYTDLRLPDPWGRTTFWLISPRLDVTMTNKLFFTAFAQYNEQQKNVNLNTRLQWRYRPASDLFIVYTDNYLPDNLGVKNRSLVLKLTYWWNI
ncbi:MAG: DUF5916 domain-containing protein [Chryseolinea sp.]